MRPFFEGWGVLGIEMETGFIKIHRKFTEWEWYSNSNTKSLFLHLLINANYKDCRYCGYEVPRGALIFGRKQASIDLKMSEMKIRTALEHLKNTKEITIKTTNKFSIIYICNYEKYQEKQPAKQQTNNQQVTTSKESKNKRSIYSPEFDEIWAVEVKGEGKANAFKAYNRALKETDHLTILEAYKNHKKAWEKEEREKRFIPLLATWINGKRWEDIVKEVKKVEYAELKYD